MFVKQKIILLARLKFTPLEKKSLMGPGRNGHKALGYISVFLLVAGICYLTSVSWAQAPRERPVFAKDSTDKPGISELKHKDKEVRRKAACALAGRKDKVAMSALVYALGDKDDNVRALAARSLGKIKDKEATPSLIAALKGEKLVVRIEAIRALNELKDKRAIEPLKRMLKSKDARERCLAAEALGRMGEKSGLDVALKEMENRNPRIRIKAIYALKEIVPQKEKGQFAEVIGALRKAQSDEHKGVRWAANFTLKYFGEK